SKSSGSNLFDGRTHRIAAGKTMASFGILTTFTGIRLPAQSVHGNSECGMGFHRNRSIRHCTSTESSHDFRPRLDLLERNLSPRFIVKVEESTKSTFLNLLV